MKRTSLVLVVVVAFLAGLGLWWARSRSDGAGASPPGAATGDSTSQTASGEPGSPGASAQGGTPSGAATGGETEAGTPYVDEPMRQEEGALRVEVVTASGPKPGARVTLYYWGTRGAQAGKPRWFVAGSGLTDDGGFLTLHARPGTYLVTARANGLATARAHVTRPRGEATTSVRLTLDFGGNLEGVTVEKGSKTPVPLVELTLTPRASSGGASIPAALSMSASMPEEERHAITSNGSGEFLFQGLALGEYQLDAKAPGRAPRRIGRVRVPTAGLTVELGGSAFIEGFVELADGKPAAGARVIASGTGDAVETDTSAGGAFSLDVPPGVYQVTAREGALTGASPSRVTVGAGMTVRDVRIRLGAEASLAGLVRRKGSGEPIAGAAISVTPGALVFSVEEDATEVASAVSAADGRFEAGALAPGMYSVTVRARGFKKWTRSGVSVLDGQRFDLTADLEAHGRIEGTVVDGDDKPLSGIHVTAESRWRMAPLEGTLVTVTDAQGAFVLEGLPPGEVFVAARRPGSETNLREGVKVMPGETSRVRLKLVEEGLLEGTVRLEGGYMPPKPVTVSALREGAPYSESIKVPATSEGAWSMRMRAGRYRLTAWMTDTGNQSGDQVKLVDLEAGGKKHVALEVREARKPILVTVLEPNGAPSVSATVMGSEVGKHEILIEDVTDASGQVTVVADGMGGTALHLWATNGGRRGDLPSVPTSRSAVTLQLSPGGRLSGSVRSAGGRPVEGFRLVAAAVRKDDDFLTTQELDFAGDRFVVEDMVSGPVTLTVTLPDGRAGKAEATCAAGTTTQVDVVVEAGGSLTGRLVDTAGAPVADAFVDVDGVLTPRTGADGRFRVEDLAPGPHRVSAWKGSGLREDREVSITPGKALDLGDWRMGPARVEPGRLGLYFGMSGDDVTVSWLAQGGPSASLRIGDVVKAIDGAAVRDPGEARQRELGAPGSPATLLILREGRTWPVTLNRAL
ncbi:carboxypeptidase regulatory-like domain-containing protein [Pyxidicoccus xibeiensis]|uniref:carboxypeptidase regulatory-like domain-containing protein n=1 Tax=Pyxidicoccus xibeiensis TaxID=2906759 RepID=UPI0020A716BC|nr:carboxypeptidase regulatory-like domain-containing protein [Pyxidicoccus xibeiensis]MCP3142392.1 carboxypeptidase regulatory-like domain-containing protein [Pyxidicoccus xibeiensis]